MARFSIVTEVSSYETLETGISDGAVLKVVSDITLEQQLSIFSGVACVVFSEAGNTLSGNNANRHFYLAEGGRLRLEGLTLSSGVDGNSGGGSVRLKRSSVLSVSLSTFISNTAELSGGALYVDEICTAIATLCKFTTSTANYDGGGVFVQTGATFQSIGCRYSGNQDTGGLRVSRRK